MGILDPTTWFKRPQTIDVLSDAVHLYKNGSIARDLSGKSNYENNFGSLASSLYQSGSSVAAQLNSYSKNSIDYACVYAIANTLADLPTKLFTIEPDGTEKVVTNNENANAILENPSPAWSWYDFVEACVTLMELAGWCPVEVVFPNEPKELWPLRVDLTEKKIDPRLGVAKYIYRVNGKVRTFDALKDEAFQFKYFNPLKFTDGFSPFNPMRLQLSADHFSMVFLNNFFQNGGHMDGILKYPIQLPKHKLEELEAMYKEKFGGTTKDFKLMIVGGKDIEFIKLAVDPKEADVGPLREMTRLDIVSTRGCYPVVLGFLDGAAYANANIQFKLFYRNTIKPKAKKMEYILNKKVFNKFGLWFKFDFSGVPELRDDEKEKAVTAFHYNRSGVITINEIRSRLNLGKPLPDGDVLPALPTPPPLPKSATDILIEKLKKKATSYGRLTG